MRIERASVASCRWLASLLAVVWLLSVQAQETPAKPLRLAVTGGGPRTVQDWRDLRRYLAEENAKGEASVLIHLGGMDKISDGLAAEALKTARLPVIALAGDLDWASQADPTAALKRWQAELGQLHRHWGEPADYAKRFPVSGGLRQAASWPTHLAWVDQGVLVLALHLPAGKPAESRAWAAHLAATTAWVQTQFTELGPKVRAAVVLGQGSLEGEREAFGKPFQAIVASFGKPVLYLHGDSTRWEEKRPTPESHLLIVRTEPLSAAPPVLVTVSAEATPSFSFDRRYQRGPYLALGTPNAMAIVWRTRAEGAPQVRYGLAPDQLTQILPATAISARTAEPKDAPNALHSAAPGVTQYEARLTGLQPATRYYYQISHGTLPLTGGADTHFTTNPPPGPAKPMRFWVVGDSGTAGSEQAMVRDAMLDWVAKHQKPLDFYLHMGDIAYSKGTDEEFQWKHFKVYQDILRQIVCWPTMGNHEAPTSNSMTGTGPYYDAHILPTRGEAGGLASGTEAYYAFDYANVHFIVLNSHDIDRQPGAAMAKWLKADLEQCQADWIIAYWHHPPYTKGSHDSDTDKQLIEMRENFMPLLEASGVDLVLTGHSHIYERSMLIDGAYETPSVATGKVLDDGDGDPAGDGAYRKSAGLHPHQGTVQVVAGHGGAILRGKGTHTLMKRVFLEHGSVIVELNGDTLTALMLNKDGVQRDLFSIVKRGTVTPQRVAAPKQMPLYTNYATHEPALSPPRLGAANETVKAVLTIAPISESTKAKIVFEGKQSNWRITPASHELTLAPNTPTTVEYLLTHTGNPLPAPELSIEYTTKDGPVKTRVGVNLPAWRSTPVGNMASTPILDGILSEAELAGLTRQSQMITLKTGQNAKPDTEFYLGRHGDQLYLAVICHEPSMSKLKAEAQPHDTGAPGDDCLEVFLQAEGSKNYYQFISNAVGATFDTRNGTGPDNIAWNGQWQVATERGKDRWTAEFLLPLASLSDDGKVPSGLRFNLCRNNVPQKDYSQWSHTNRQSSHRPEFFGHAVLAK